MMAGQAQQKVVEADCVYQMQSDDESEKRYAGCQSLAVNDSMSQQRVSANVLMQRKAGSAECSRAAADRRRQMVVACAGDGRAAEARRWTIYLCRDGAWAGRWRCGATGVAAGSGSGSSSVSITGEIRGTALARGRAGRQDCSSIRSSACENRFVSPGSVPRRRHLRPGSSGCASKYPRPLRRPIAARLLRTSEDHHFSVGDV